MKPLLLPDGRSVNVCLERKNVKNINIRIKPDGVVYVSAGRRVPEKYILELLLERSRFITSALDELAARRPASGVPVLHYLGESFPLETTLSDDTRAVLTDGKLRVFSPDITDGDRLAAIIKSWQTEQFMPLCDSLNKEVCAAFRSEGYDVPLSVLRIKDMKTRWGSCSFRSGRMSISLRLCEYPVGCVRAVFYHEYAHYLHPDHSRAFYRVLYEIFPEYEKYNRLLKAK